MNNKLQLTSYGSRVTGHGSRKNTASALILAVVLTSLLAIIGVMFVMIARVDKMATSAISENKELNFAVETVVAKISQELVLDVPGMPKGWEYYDYPDTNNAWLANLEPYDDGGTYKWRQISDVTGFLNDKGFSTQNVNVEPVGLITTVYVHDYPVIRVDPNGRFLDDKTGNIATDGVSADADGDGVADSKWVELDDITSNKGKPIYAAIRIVDNGGMLNVNTAYKFNPNETDSNLIDGSSQLQINLEALARGSDTIDDINDERNPLSRPLSDYQDEVIWKIEDPCSDYLPFDISDELELRNRFFLTSLAKTRLEATWNSTIGSETFKRVPYDSDMVGWFAKFDPDSNEPDRRHLLTTCNMDRIIDHDCNKMTNINKADAYSIYRAVKSALDPNFVDANGVAAQIAVNLVDFRDNDSNVTVYPNPDDGNDYYGFESPCIYISELVHRFVEVPNPIPGEPNIIYRSYAVELYKPYSGDNDPCNWRLEVGSTPITIDNWTGNKQFYVIRDQNSNALLDVNSGTTIQDALFAFTRNTEISLQRPLPGGGYVTVDSVPVPDPNDASGWLVDPPTIMYNGVARSIQRDIQPHKCIRRLWDSNVRVPNLGQQNTFVHPDPNVIQAHPANEDFTNIGEIGMLFRKGAYYIDAADRPDRIGYGTNKTEEEVRIDLADPNFQQLFKYLTVFDPNSDTIDNDGDGEIDETDPNKTLELKVPGRININTAPWYVLAQLPWVSLRESGYNDANLAHAIVAYRDNLNLSSTGGPDYYHSGASNSRELETGITGISEANGFRSIGELMNVINKSGKTDYDIRSYGLDSQDQKGFPDLDEPSGDGAIDDFEERDVIFARISNLVMVRSDVFTAYILVRIGTDGPQKRVMAILDRSNVYSGDGKVRIVALHPVPDPR